MARYLRENYNGQHIVRDAHEMTLTALDNSASMPVGKHYVTNRGGEEQYWSLLRPSIECMQVCKACLELKVGLHGDRDPGVSCVRRCNTCDELSLSNNAPSMCDRCSDAGVGTTHPLLRPCLRCAAQKLPCHFAHVMTLSLDGASCQFSLLMRLHREYPVAFGDAAVRRALAKTTLICPVADPTHLCNKFNTAKSNWVLLVGGCLTTHRLFRAMWDDEDDAIASRLHESSLTRRAMDHDDRMSPRDMRCCCAEDVIDVLRSILDVVAVTLLPDYVYNAENGKNDLVQPCGVAEHPAGGVFVCSATSASVHLVKLSTPCKAVLVGCSRDFKAPTGLVVAGNTLVCIDPGKPGMMAADLGPLLLQKKKSAWQTPAGSGVKLSGVCWSPVAVRGDAATLKVVATMSSAARGKQTTFWLVGTEGLVECTLSLAGSKPTCDAVLVWRSPVGVKLCHAVQKTTDDVWVTAEHNGAGAVFAVTRAAAAWTGEHMPFVGAGVPEKTLLSGIALPGGLCVVADEHNNCLHECRATGTGVLTLHAFSGQPRPSDAPPTDSMRDGVGSSAHYYRPGQLVSVGRSLLLADTGDNRLCLVTPVDGLTKSMAALQKLCVAFNVADSKGAPCELGLSRALVAEARHFLDEHHAAVVAARGSHLSTNCDGTTRSYNGQLKKGMDILGQLHGRLQCFFKYCGSADAYNTMDVRAVLELACENFFRGMMLKFKGSVPPTALAYNQVRRANIVELIKAVDSHCGFHYATTEKKSFHGTNKRACRFTAEQRSEMAVVGATLEASSDPAPAISNLTPRTRQIMTRAMRNWLGKPKMSSVRAARRAPAGTRTPAAMRCVKGAIDPVNITMSELLAEARASAAEEPTATTLPRRRTTESAALSVLFSAGDDVAVKADPADPANDGGALFYLMQLDHDLEGWEDETGVDFPDGATAQGRWYDNPVTANEYVLTGDTCTHCWSVLITVVDLVKDDSTQPAVYVLEEDQAEAILKALRQAPTATPAQEEEYEPFMGLPDGDR